MGKHRTSLTPDPAHGAIVGTLAGADAPPELAPALRLIPASELELERFPTYADASTYRLRPSHRGGGTRRPLPPFW